MNHTSDSLEIPAESTAEIEKAIASEQSVVGIDAKKTHIIIIHMLREIRAQVNQIEARLDALEKQR